MQSQEVDKINLTIFPMCYLKLPLPDRGFLLAPTVTEVAPKWALKSGSFHYIFSRL